MSASATPAGVEEAPCPECIRNKGLCRRHERDILPTLAEFPWRKWMGEPYVCTNAICEEHRKCLDVPGHAAPRAECGCHNCSQRRWQRARAAQLDEPTAAAVKAQRRNARRERKGTVRSIDRLSRAMNGAFTRNARLKHSEA